MTLSRVAEVILIACYLVSSSRAFEDVTSTLKSESTLITTTAPVAATSTTTTATIFSTSIQADANQNVTTIATSPKDPELPVDVLSPEKVLLDPNVVLARIARDTYGGWNQGQGYGSWNQRQGYGSRIEGQEYDTWNQNKKQRFGSPYERRPFGIQGYYRPNGLYKPEQSRRRSDVRKIQVTQRPFRVYPVFPG